MRLRTLESFGLIKNGLLYSYPSLQNNLDADIVVVGAGISGALTAHALIENGYAVTLVDKRDVGQGSTAASTSLLQYEIDVPLYLLAGMIGEKNAARCYQAGIDAIQKLDNLLQVYQVDCGFKNKKSLYIAHSRNAVKNLQQEFKIRNKYNLGVQWLSARDVLAKYGVVCYGAILSDTAASMDVYKLTQELIQINLKKGMQVYDQTEILTFETHKTRPVIILKNDSKIRCNKIIFCTGFETTKMLKEHVAKLFYTYACVSETKIELPEQLHHTLLWDTHDPYTYMRTTEDGRLLVGGEDSSINFPFFQNHIKERKSMALIKKVNHLIPGIHFIEDFSWGGSFGSTKDGLPYIGQSPEFKNALFVLAFGGNGITFSVQAMEIIPLLLKGKKHALANDYRFGR